MYRQRQTKFVTKPNFVLFNKINNEQIIGDLINEDEIEGKKYFVMKIKDRVVKLSKDAYTNKKR